MISKIIVLSLNSALERRQTFVNAAKDTDLQWEFFDACTGLSPYLLYDAEEAEETNGRRLLPGEIGCYSSHVEIWLRLIDDDVDQYIVLEDDVVVDWGALEDFAHTSISNHGFNYMRLFYKHP